MNLDFFGWMQAAFEGLIPRVMQVLPRSPFSSFHNLAGDVPFLGMVNWFVPVSEMIAIVEAWTVAIALYYLYSVVARWVKLIT